MEKQTPTNIDRRSFFSKFINFFMISSVVAGYGAFLSFAGRFLYPSKPREKQWLFVGELARIKKGDSLRFVLPNGGKVAIARQGTKGTAEDFVALSSVCPHLGCQVHWEGPNDRFFCPCHNGVFDPKGLAVSGPPADANQNLARYPLKIDNGLLFIEAIF